MKKICQRCGQPFDGGRYTSMCKSCRNGSKRRVKVVDVFDVEWVQIPCAPKYEISQTGNVRVVKTGKLRKPTTRRNGEKVFSLRVTTGGKPKNFTLNSLLWLTHGTIRKSRGHKHSCISIPVIMTKGNRQYWFESCRQAAKFLSQQEKLAHSTIVNLIAKRPKEIFGWRINYQR